MMTLGARGDLGDLYQGNIALHILHHEILNLTNEVSELDPGPTMVWGWLTKDIRTLIMLVVQLKQNLKTMLPTTMHPTGGCCWTKFMSTAQTGVQYCLPMYLFICLSLY